MFSKFRALILILVASFLLSGCGDLLGKKVVKKELGTSQFEVSCELDLDKFVDIMHENISSQIRCLGENLNLFIKIVKSEKPGYLSRAQLEQYLARYRPDVKPEVIKALKSVFDLGHLITGEDPNYISKEVVDKVINFALVFNQEAALNFGPIFQNESPVTFALHQNHRERVSRATRAIIQALRLVYNPNRNGQIHKLNIIELMESFTTESTRPSIEKAKKILFLKKVILGGDNEIISHYELEKLIINFDQLVLIGLDIVRYNYIILNQESILQLVRKDVSDFYDMITQGDLNNRDEEILFTVNEAIEAAKLFVEQDQLDLEKFRSLIAEVKKIVMKGNTAEVRGIEVKNLFHHALAVLKTGTVFHRIYDKFKIQLASPRPVEETIDFDEYRHTYPEHQSELDQFERIAKRYRFMKGEFFSSYYTRGSKRNPDAFFEIALFEFALKLVFSTYGSPSPNADAVGGYSMNQEDMQKLILKFETELIELDLLTPQSAIVTADNISLLGTLFQNQSDKNGFLDVNEGAEFAVSLFSAINISKDIHHHMKEVNCSTDPFDRIEPECFKANFWVGLCKYYRPYFPFLFKSFDTPMNCGEGEDRISPTEMPSWVTSEMQNVLIKARDAARTCNFYTDGDKEEIYYSEGEIMSIMLAITHAETTILRWDVNNNNYMDPDEIERSYEIYSPALDGFLEARGALIKRLKKQIFLYMVKYGEVPDEKDFGKIWKFVKFMLSFNKKTNAYRGTILSILDVVGKENKKLQTGPVLDCNLLRDPENIPREPIFEDKPFKNTFSQAQIEQAFKSLGALLNSYGPRAKEELIIELEAFSDDMSAGKVTKIRHVKQPMLKDLFRYISRNKSMMRDIEVIVPEGSQLHRVAFAVSSLLME